MSNRILKLFIALAACLLALCLNAPGARGQVIFTNLVFFTGTNGPAYGDLHNYQLNGGMVRADDGNLYGTTVAGGPGGWLNGGCGTVFRLTPDGAFTTIYAFGTATDALGNLADGELPLGNLINGTNGILYGTTSYGSSPAYGGGAVFQITTNGLLSYLHLFGNNVGYDAALGIYTNYDGNQPDAGVVLGGDGNFYGTTYDYGAHGYGTVFQLTPGGVLTTLYAFTTPSSDLYENSDGALPTGQLVEGGDGNFYGTTVRGGTYGYGVVFRISPGGTFTNLHSFSGLADGGIPLAGLALGRDGSFYGITYISGAALPGDQYGTVFQITTNGTLTTLHSFVGVGGGTNLIDGIEPVGGLIQASDGNFYGTTTGGSVFQMTTNGAITLLHVFSSADGADGLKPAAQLVEGPDGNLYGTASQGGIGYTGYGTGNGTLFRILVPPAFQTIAPANGGVTLAWSAMSNQVCQLQYSTNLLSTNWFNLGGPVTVTNSPATMSDTIGADAQRFYRIQLMP